MTPSLHGTQHGRISYLLEDAYQLIKNFVTPAAVASNVSLLSFTWQVSGLAEDTRLLYYPMALAS